MIWTFSSHRRLKTRLFKKMRLYQRHICYPISTFFLLPPSSRSLYFHTSIFLLFLSFLIFFHTRPPPHFSLMK
ncbi:hypothetical protein B0J14DRAFT_598472 [Halenospora varia]|nr:hypothetical protein B0J14DRAFT_598472 [Halenospora varia]